MNTVNVSRGTGWIRVILAVAGFGAVALGAYLLVMLNGTLQWNLDGGNDVRFYLFIALYIVTFLAAVVGIISGVAAVRSPGRAQGWALNVGLVVLLALTLWTRSAILDAVVFLDL